MPADAPEVEFTSTLFPFLVEARRGITVHTVPAAELAGAVDESIDLVAFSAVQMATGEVVHASYFGPPLRLAANARRLDTSPAWHSWVGAAPALALIEELGVATIHEHDVRLANLFRAGLGLAESDSAIVFVDSPGAEERLERAGIRAAVRNGRLRTSWHIYNTEEDVEHALAALTV